MRYISDVDVAALHAQKAALQSRMDELAALFAEGSINAAQLKRGTAELANALDDLTRSWPRPPKATRSPDSSELSDVLDNSSNGGPSCHRTSRQDRRPTHHRDRQPVTPRTQTLRPPIRLNRMEDWQMTEFECMSWDIWHENRSAIREFIEGLFDDDDRHKLWRKLAISERGGYGLIGESWALRTARSFFHEWLWTMRRVTGATT